MQLDELVVKLVLDASGFTQGQKDATAAAQKGAADLKSSAEVGEKAQSDMVKAMVDGLNRLSVAMEKQGEQGERQTKRTVEGNKKVAGSFEGMIRTGLTFLAVLAGARTVEEFTRKITALDAALGRTAYGLGQSPQALSAIGKAVERMGGSAEGAVGGLRALSDAYQEFRTTGSSALIEPLTRLQALSGKSVTFGKDVKESFLSIGEALHALDQKGEHALADSVGRQIFGDEGLANEAKKGRAAILADMAESERHGVVDPKDVKAAQDLQAAYVGLSQSVVGLGTKLETALSPYLSAVLKQLDELIQKHGNEWVKEFGGFLEKHKPDIEHFGTALGDLVKAVDGIATSFSSGSPASVALEAFATLLGIRVVGAVTGLSTAMRLLGGLPVPAVLARLLGLAGGPAVAGTLAVGAVLASGDPEKSVLAGGRPDVQPQDNDTGLPGVDTRPSDTTDAQAKASGAWGWFTAKMKEWGYGDRLPKEADGPPLPPERPSGYAGPGEDGNALHRNDETPAPQQGGLWAMLKRITGFGDDPAVREHIEDTEKNTRGILDIMKAERDGSGSGQGGVTASSGGLGGSGQHVGGGSSPGAALGDRAGRGGAAAMNASRTVAEGLTPEARALLDTISSGEAHAYNIMNGGATFSGYGQHPQPYKGGRAAGRYQFLGSTWLGIQRETGLKDFSPESQDKGAWYLAQRDYRLRTGRNLQADLASKDPARLAQIGRELAPTWVSLNGSFAGKYNNYFARDSAHPNASPVAAAAPSVGPAVSDQANAEAEARLRTGRGTAEDRATRARYLKEQNTPPKHGAPIPSWQSKDGSSDGITTNDMRDPRFAPHPDDDRASRAGTLDPAHQKLADAMRAGAGNPIKVDLTHESAQRIGQMTLGHVGREFLHAVRQSEKLLHHTRTPSGLPQALHDAIHGHSAIRENHRTLLANTQSGAHYARSVANHSTDRRVSNATTINGGLHVHSAATDARGIVADLEPVFRRASDAGDFNYGLDG